MTELGIVEKVRIACAFGTPNAFISAEIVEEVYALNQKVQKVREVLEAIKGTQDPAAWAGALETIAEVLDD